MGDYTNIKAEILSKLDEITEIKKSYGYSKGLTEDYPCAVIKGWDLDKNDWEDSATSMREWIFTIKVYQEMEKEGQGAEKAEKILDSIVDELFNKFDNNRDFTGVGGSVGCWIKGSSHWEDRELKMRGILVEIRIKKPYTLGS